MRRHYWKPRRNETQAAIGKPSAVVGACWKCKGEGGKFRNLGAASPVWCDSCWNAYQEAERRRQGALADDDYLSNCL